ncbi:MAG: tRNA lysidine(34) synthetase TilS [Fibrobacter sp.]|uniref:tRNA lysidine(34) synthetase TilS n=1 Tax=Fibrobacter sp. TaxID=35828 RepID=UPI0025C2362C|nr:tRNA lysidine(34) synthetase TilS [Fibrobacter sp.]MBR4784294.1 tRNA lysidine(34) synthetase TilS [Fibrobacter sp.]
MTIDIADRIRRHGFKRLLLAVSGGLDSICLAHYFIKNREALGIEWLGIAHVHHGLREGTADRDAQFVEAFAKSHGIPFFLKKLDGNALKTAEGSLEENARDARYEALMGIAEANKCAIVTAHHAGDQAETMYMRLRRGTTLAGMRGIQALRQNIYRPFLDITREELLAYARENGLEWCEDESNADVKFARNFIRHDALPHLEETCPGATMQLCRIAGLADRAYAKVMEACERVFSPALRTENADADLHQHDMKGDNQHDTVAGMTQYISLNKKALRKMLLEHADSDLSEMFRLWLSEQGLRFPIAFFYGPKEPAHIKIPHRAAYRRRSIVKNGHTVRICAFESAEAALKFVSCESKEKGY